MNVTASLLALMLILGVADATLMRNGEWGMGNGEEVVQTSTDEEVEHVRTDAPTGAVRKNSGPNVKEALVNNRFTFTETKESIILEKVLEGNKGIQKLVLLNNGDRAGAIAWVSSPNVKKHYLVLKEALHAAFSPAVRDLLDETQRREGRPTRNLLTFMDPGLMPERIVFVRVRERLYEFHVAEGSSDAIFNLIEDLTR